MTFDELILPFIESVANGQTEIYNEFSLQHELGIFLRAQNQAWNVRFERNVRSIFPSQSSFTKREIDIVITSDKAHELEWAIELKFPRNGQYPEQMFSFCKDVSFVEQLKAVGFQKAALLIFAEDPLFWRGPTSGIYGFFRGALPLHGTVQKPTGSKDEQVKINGSYTVSWRPASDKLKFASIEV